MSSFTVAGNLTEDPVLRFGNDGGSFVTFKLVHNIRMKDKKTEQWIDGDPLFVDCILSGLGAENLAESVQKGDRLLVLGQLNGRVWEKDGKKVYANSLRVEEVAVSVKFHTAKPVRVGKDSKVSAPRQSRGTPPSQSDPWSGSEGDPPF